MPTLREYFVSESTEYFTQLTEQMNRLDASRGDPVELQRIARALRGSAQLARENRVHRAGLGLEAAVRAVSGGVMQWSSDISDKARRTVEDLQALANGGETEDAADARVKRVLERWRDLGVTLPSDGPAVGASSGERSAASRQFREFAAHEVAGIAAEIDSSLSQLAQDPRNRDILKGILRRQRTLMGAARLEEINVVAETLRAVEDLVRVIHKLNVAVKEEWAMVFRAARDVLTASLEPLRQGNDPTPTPALSKLRTLRTELLDRFGEGAAVAVTGGPPKDPMAAATSLGTTPPRTPAAPGAVPTSSSPAPTAASAAPAATPAPQVADEGRVIPIEELCYGGERALRRALELRPKLENMAGDDSDSRDSVEELFDLLRLGIG